MIQIPGSKCGQCGSGIVTILDGAICDPCAAVYCNNCIGATEKCPKCGAQVHKESLPQHDEANGSRSFSSPRFSGGEWMLLFISLQGLAGLSLLMARVFAANETGFVSTSASRMGGAIGTLIAIVVGLGSWVCLLLSAMGFSQNADVRHLTQRGLRFTVISYLTGSPVLFLPLILESSIGSSVSDMTGRILAGTALLLFQASMALFVFGAAYLMEALVARKKADRTFRTRMWIVAVVWFFTAPIGTVLSLIATVHLSRHKRNN